MGKLMLKTLVPEKGSANQLDNQWVCSAEMEMDCQKAEEAQLPVTMWPWHIQQSQPTTARRRTVLQTCMNLQKLFEEDIENLREKLSPCCQGPESVFNFCFGGQGSAMPWVQAGLCLVPLVLENNPEQTQFTATDVANINPMRPLSVLQIELVQLNR